MKSKKGYYRIVFIFPFLGFAIKFPKIHLLEAILQLFWVFFNCKWKTFCRILSSPVESELGTKSQVFGGIMVNWQEFLFFHNTKHPFLQPTYFSFFGLINIQKMGKPCHIDAGALWSQFYKLTNGGAWADPHHFKNPGNFCFDDGRLRIFDYGSKKTQGIITEYGITIFESFDPSYDWEKKK
ncbi:MAG: hypothetical protein A2599_02625 [Candidatus Staskawiczbacteria bacterium RIFOXYD1_FULL_39_28]|uniref:Protein kinase domain-containing protein n=1 Tax=Candidatus Staskawiczbacteria bacterium RIFOXYC1_FULL_38_18 TaxID=1802229 RepID=A0A1G2JFJ8_9BACT|nr:MAG: hypothetical protein A2401_02600 [Candidatus Staskawiczbacteria bacterium RIFOXYC1_FULL_38_18]OGZ90550.1 MAG: hypothetical protein A2599_02625 [Candidatus Staskawiczbacteria bacterium RIFOXYD1_FULL_39_28]